MAITVSAVQTFGHRAILSVIKEVWDVGASLPFDSSYLVADSYGNKFLYPGMILAWKDANADEYVPYNAAGSYGSYSTYPCGVLYTFHDCTFQKQIVAPATRAAVIEAYCYVFGGSLGVISDTVKEHYDMRLIQWD